MALCALAGAARAAVEDYVPADAIGIVKVQDPVAQFDKIRSSALVRKLEDPSVYPDAAAGIERVRRASRVFETEIT